VPAPPRLGDGAAHQRSADAAAAALRVDCERAEKKGRPVEAGRDVPQPHRADDAAIVGGNQGQAGGRHPADAQPLAGLGEARLAERAVEVSRAETSEGRSWRMVTMAVLIVRIGGE
jgi:hypothetical protein